jgi:hypothetical protein
MAANPIDELRLSLMKDVLPVGMAVVERARRGGPREVFDAFSTDRDPLATLQQEGEDAARQVRDSLDRVRPGLGNPVLQVDVRDEGSGAAPGEDEGDLVAVLERIDLGLALLEKRLPGSGA